MNAETNKQIVLQAFNTLFNKRDYAAAERFGRLTTYSTARISIPAVTASSISLNLFLPACGTSQASASPKEITSSCTDAFQVMVFGATGLRPTSCELRMACSWSTGTSSRTKRRKLSRKAATPCSVPPLHRIRKQHE